MQCSQAMPTDTHCSPRGGATPMTARRSRRIHMASNPKIYRRPRKRLGCRLPAAYPVPSWLCELQLRRPQCVSLLCATPAPRQDHLPTHLSKGATCQGPLRIQARRRLAGAHPMRAASGRAFCHNARRFSRIACLAARAARLQRSNNDRYPPRPLAPGAYANFRTKRVQHLGALAEGCDGLGAVAKMAIKPCQGRCLVPAH